MRVRDMVADFDVRRSDITLILLPLFTAFIPIVAVRVATVIRRTSRQPTTSSPGALLRIAGALLNDGMAQSALDAILIETYRLLDR